MTTMATNVTTERPAKSAYDYLCKLNTKLTAALEKAESGLRGAGLWGDRVAYEIMQRRYDCNTKWVKEALLHWGRLEVNAASKKLGLLVRSQEL